MSYIKHSILLSLLMITGHVHATATLNFQRYDNNNNVLYMHLVTSTTQGDVLLRAKEKMIQLKNAKLENLFTLSVPVPCEHLASGAVLYWATGKMLLQTSIPPQACQREPILSPIKILDKNGECWLDIGNNTLWRVATEMSKLNKATIYQNIYAVFLTNRELFVGEDINQLNNSLLKCPTKELVYHLTPEDTHRVFREMLKFKNKK